MAPLPRETGRYRGLGWPTVVGRGTWRLPGGLPGADPTGRAGDPAEYGDGYDGYCGG